MWELLCSKECLLCFQETNFYINAAFEEWRIIKESIPDSFYASFYLLVYTAKDVKVEIFPVIHDGLFQSLFTQMRVSSLMQVPCQVSVQWSRKQLLLRMKIQWFTMQKCT